MNMTYIYTYGMFFNDYKQAFYNISRGEFYEVLLIMGIPFKIINFARMSMNTVSATVKVKRTCSTEW
jgi:hypothetical protein